MSLHGALINIFEKYYCYNLQIMKIKPEVSPGFIPILQLH